MEHILSKRLCNYISFSIIKVFVEDLCSVYGDECNKDADALNAYNHFINDADILEDTNDFVEGFHKALSGTRKADFCDGVYINIPAYLKRKDENNEIILNYLEQLKKIQEDPKTSRELQFFFKITNNISTENIPEPENNSSADEKYIRNILDNLKPGMQKTQKEFKEQNLNIDNFIKIILIIVYEKVENLQDIFKDDIVHVKNLIKIIANTSLSELPKKKLELLSEFMSIKNIKNIPFQNIMSHVTNGTQMDLNTL